MARLVGRGPALPRAGVRAHPPCAPTDRDGRRHNLPLRHYGFEAALKQAKVAAGDRNVGISGGASTVRQALAAGALDELMLDTSPVLLGQGERLFDGLDDPGLEPVEVIHSPHATHVRYRIKH